MAGLENLLAFRVLTQINYSAGENPDGDSGMHFTAGLLLALVRLDSDFHFYVLVPARHETVWAKALSHPRITPIAIPIEPRLHGGDFQFCPVRLRECFDLRRFDVDLLFVNQPETAPALLHFFNRQTFHNIPAVSYVHWFDTRRPSSPKETLHHPALLGALTGMMVSNSVGCNSEFGREQLLSHASRWFHAEAVEGLAGRMRILAPGVDVEEIEAARRTSSRRRQPQVVVNHRLLKYTGVRSLLTDSFPRIWKQRQDFSVAFTNPTRVRLPKTITNAQWLTVETLGRPEYLRLLWASDIVVAPHRACHWSISTLEAICAECVPLMNRESFFPELMEPLIAGLSSDEIDHIRKHWFYFRGSLSARLGELLDNLPFERRLVRKVSAQLKHTYGWSNLARSWRQVFLDAEKDIPTMPRNNPSMRRISEFVKGKSQVSKSDILKHLRWAPKQRALSWTAFRKRLKLMAHEDASSPDSIFEMLKKRSRRRKSVNETNGRSVKAIAMKRTLRF